MIPFEAPLADILFSLNHVAGASRLDDCDADTTAEVLGHFAQFAEGVIAPLNAIGDANGVRLDNGHITMPPGFGTAYQQLADSGWQGLSAPEAYGGMELSPVIGVGVSEIFSGANHAMQMVCNLVPGAISTLLRFGTDAQQQAWIPKLADGTALSTMCLTEAAAGSDLSAIRTKATQKPDGWRIDGEKIFISGGDQDMSDDILHLVLARSGEAEDGVKGLSLFLCPKQPGAKVTRIEEKLGLHASPTCQMVFDDASAELIGQEGGGLQAMFTLMNHARLDVGLQGVAHGGRAAQIAQAYASERKQGRTATGAPAMLEDHSDVRRMLDAQIILTMGARAMCHLAIVNMEANKGAPLAEFLTPLCKVFGTEAGLRSADLGIQILGGYGYLTEYGVEQVWRDARICAIYEGANGIHTRTLVTRGLRPGGGADDFDALTVSLSQDEPRVTSALEKWRDLRAQLEKADDPSAQAQAFYKVTAELALKAVWTRIAQVGEHHANPALISRLANKALNHYEDAL